VYVVGLDLAAAREVAAALRERGGGFRGLRALGLYLQEQDRVQISMNLEDPERTFPLDVFDALEGEVVLRGGRVAETQVIGMIPDALVHPAAVDRLLLSDFRPARVLSRRIAEYVLKRTSGRTTTSERAE
jgi:glutamate formiminotransferase